MWDNGIIEQVPREESVGCGPVVYMPHRPVIRGSSVSMKVRPVFDASAKGLNSLSLNDCMEVGPCLLSHLTEILLCFHQWQIAITSDIEKAFLQISVKKDDCDVHRFWGMLMELPKLCLREFPLVTVVARSYWMLLCSYTCLGFQNQE